MKFKEKKNKVLYFNKKDWKIKIFGLCFSSRKYEKERYEQQELYRTGGATIKEMTIFHNLRIWDFKLKGYTWCQRVSFCNFISQIISGPDSFHGERNHIQKFRITVSPDFAIAISEARR